MSHMSYVSGQRPSSAAATRTIVPHRLLPTHRKPDFGVGNCSVEMILILSWAHEKARAIRLPLRHEVGERAGVRWCSGLMGQGFYKAVWNFEFLWSLDAWSFMRRALPATDDRPLITDNFSFILLFYHGGAFL